MIRQGFSWYKVNTRGKIRGGMVKICIYCNGCFIIFLVEIEVELGTIELRTDIPVSIRVPRS